MHQDKNKLFLLKILNKEIVEANLTLNLLNLKKENTTAGSTDIGTIGLRIVMILKECLKKKAVRLRL